MEAMEEITEYAVPQVGAWLHPSWDSPPAREVAARPDFWNVGALSRDELTRLIQTAGGVEHNYALEARRLLSGEVLLIDGCHRWAVANELGMPSVPVKMSYEVEPENEVWPAWD
jgi:hypothetical protein